MNSNQFQQDKDNAKFDAQREQDYSDQFHADCDKAADAQDAQAFSDAQSVQEDKADYQRQSSCGFGFF